MADVNQEILIKLKALDELTPVMLKALQAMDAQTARMAQALDRVSQSSDQTRKNTEGLHGGLVSLHAGWELVKDGAEIVMAAFEKLHHHFEKAIEEALAAEKANTRFTGALVQAGVYTKALNRELEEHISRLEKTVGANGDVVKGMIATGLQMGLNVDQAKSLEQASRQLAAANGITVNEAFNALKGSLAGNSRALAQLVPQVKDMTTASLKQGAAIELVSKQTKAQYDIFQTSLPAALARGETAIASLYKAFGQAFVENAAVRAGVQEIVSGLQHLAEWTENNKDQMKKWVTEGLLVVLDVVAALGTGFDALYRVGVVAFEGIKGAIASLAMGIRTLIDGPIFLFYKALSYLPGEKGKAFQQAADEMMASMAETADSVNNSAANIEKALSGQTEASKMLQDGILKVRDAMLQADADEKQTHKTKEGTLELTSRQIAAQLKLADTYAGFSIGTAKQRRELEAQAADRDQSYKKFEDYYNNLTRMAVSQAEEQEARLAKFRASKLGSGGPEAKVAGADAEVEAEQIKQTELARLRQAGLISIEQYHEEVFASEHRVQQQQLAASLAFAQAKAEALGETEAALEARKQREEATFQLQLQQRMERAALLGATEEEIQAQREQAEAEHKGRMAELGVNFYENQAKVHEASGDEWEASLDKVKAAFEKHHNALDAIAAVSNTKQFKGAMDTLNNLSTLRNSHSKKAFEVGKKAAIAEATVKTFLAATEAYSSLAAIPIVGPALGAAAAAAAIAAGFVNIQKINSQQFGGGQADSGMDSIPQNLDGKSFILSAGERVIQPTANKQLTEFLNRESSGGGRGGSNYNITLHYNGSGSSDDARRMAEMVMKEIRQASERGAQIVSSKGVY